MSEPTPTDDESIDGDQATTDADPTGGEDSQPGAEAASSRRTYLKATGLLAAVGLGGVASSGTAAAQSDYDHLGESWAGAAGSDHGLEVTEESSTGFSYGLRGISDSEKGRGVFGLATAESGRNFGLWGKTESTEGTGLSGTATASTGLTQGVLATSKSDQGRGVFGRATSSSGDTIGVRGQSLSDTGTGVRGEGGTNGYGVVSEGDAKVTEFLEAARAGTRGDTALELDVDGQRALRIEPTSSDSGANIVGGHPSNSAASGVEGATIAGGGYDDGSTPRPNTVEGYYGTVGGGEGNTASGSGATVGGGEDNTASGTQATVPGGDFNTASGDYSFASGNNAKAADNGAFVWNDGSLYHDSDGNGFDDGFSSAKDVAGSGVTGTDTFHASAQGGFRFVTGSSSVTYISGGSSGWATTSTRAAKTNIDSVDPTQVLEGVADMEVATWEYKDEDGEGTGERHIGPMAEDFHAAVDVGTSDEHINSINADGVALAAIQGLAERLNEKADRIEELKQASERKDERIEELESEAEAAREENAELEATIDDLAARLEAVENQLDPVAAD